ncbi:N-terminal cleavage protein [Acidovorax sp. Leaf78]|nr:N-terminal cleavage protein [Acidovorax sp. Leaf78]
MPPFSGQRGVTLLELMVGIAIGLLVVAVAMSALMISRSISGTVSDASTIQQQGAYAMRLFGQQLRQAGSMRLNLNPGSVVTASGYLAPVGFETAAESASSPAFSYTANVAKQTISGTDSPDSLTVGFRRYTEAVFTSASEKSLTRNCLGGPDDASSTDQRMQSVFDFDSGNFVLRCAGNSAASQPILQNVANFQVRYLLQDTTSTPSIPMIKLVDATGVTNNWPQVQAVEVCVVLFGNERIDLPAGSTYTDCDGSTSVDMSMLSGIRAKRMHIAFRNVFQLRSQGIVGSPVLPAAM